MADYAHGNLYLGTKADAELANDSLPLSVSRSAAWQESARHWISTRRTAVRDIHPCTEQLVWAKLVSCLVGVSSVVSCWPIDCPSLVQHYHRVQAEEFAHRSKSQILQECIPHCLHSPRASSFASLVPSFLSHTQDTDLGAPCLKL